MNRDDQYLAGGLENITREVIFDLLSSPRRRRVIRYLLRREGKTDFRTLTDEIAAIEADTTVDALGSDERKPVYVSLRQTHLPKLDDAGVVTYDRDRGTITPRGLLSMLDPPLRAVDQLVGPASLELPRKQQAASENGHGPSEDDVSFTSSEG